jgi:hypothetical protein
MAQARF